MRNVARALIAVSALAPIAAQAADCLRPIICVQSAVVGTLNVEYSFTPTCDRPADRVKSDVKLNRGQTGVVPLKADSAGRFNRKLVTLCNGFSTPNGYIRTATQADVTCAARKAISECPNIYIPKNDGTFVIQINPAYNPSGEL